ncbi:MAG: hypothetical protein FWE92_04805, partial [Defluviitaleaceae bacterium]|nr:hypothetical protein [Defluviitaleaceae bacterium]
MKPTHKKPSAYGELVILALESSKELAEKVDQVLLRRYEEDADFEHDEAAPDTFLVPVTCRRFASGDGKV